MGTNTSYEVIIKVEPSHVEGTNYYKTFKKGSFVLELEQFMKDVTQRIKKDIEFFEKLEGNE